MPSRSSRSAPGRHVLAIDLGSGGAKVGVVSEVGEVLAQAARPVPLTVLEDGGVEQDPEAWWRAVAAASRAAMAEAGVPPGAVVGVGCTSQWSVTAAVDREGSPLAPAVHWLDGRGGPYNRALVRGFPSVQGYGVFRTWPWLRRTGLAPTRSGVDALGHLLFIKHERPEVYREAFKFLEPMDFLTFRLTGRCTATQHTMVPTLLVDNRTWGTTTYSPPLLKAAGIDQDKLPTLVPNDAILGTIAEHAARSLGLSPETRIIAGANDTSCSAIGAGAVACFDAVIYIGTSQVLTCHLPHRKTDPLHMMTTMPSPLRDRHLLLAEQGSGGKCLEFFLNNLVYADDPFQPVGQPPSSAGPPTGTLPSDAYERFDRAAAATPPGAGGVLFLPWLTGAMAPAENASARGAFFNLSLSTGRPQLARAVLEGLAFNSRWTIESSRFIVGRRFNRVRLAGGGARCRCWAQIHADILGLPVQVLADPTDVTLRGAAFLALDRLGVAPIQTLASRVAFDRIVEPNPKRQAIYDRIYRQWRQLQRRAVPIFQALNG